ncbi:MAG TPA: sialate O-acetylesterase [Paludibacteraceae bacterium]|nr:sialate O-acetylesterase [Paludibacteraceae bacterium]
MQKLITCLFALLLTLGMVHAQVDPNFHIYVCFGQSNMQGNATPEDQDKQGIDDRYLVLESMPDGCWHNGGKWTQWRKAVPPLLCSGGLGVTDYFGREMVKNAKSNERIGIVIAASGGCDIRMFLKNGYQGDYDHWHYVPEKYYSNGGYASGYAMGYQWLLDLCKEAQKSGVIKGFLLHQGETNNGQKEWLDWVSTIMDDLHKDLGLTERLPLLAGEMVSQEVGGACWYHNSVIAQLPSRVQNSYVISSAGLDDKGDGLHFTAASYRTFGSRYAAKMLEVQKETPNVASFGCTPPLHVDGKNLKDTQGNTVVLHGVMDTPNPYFNNWRWGFAAPCDDRSVDTCRKYFGKLFDAITDTEQGAYCNVFRLHLDPCWTNADGANVSGESDISAFQEAKLQKYLESLFVPLAEDANGHGMYVVIRPPGVCPEEIRVNGDYQKYLMTVWNVVSKNKIIQENSGRIFLELANEPVRCYDANGVESGQADNVLRDFFQPIVDMIRKNGYDGILWIPGTGWQSQYGNYAKYPITGDNIGYAVHVYPGWYGNDDNNYSAQSFIDNFKKQVPVVETNPIIITECDWSPGTPDLDENGNYQYNWDQTIKTKNLGTWGTASTSKWGSAFKAMKDHYGNISLTLTGTSDYVDVDIYLKEGRVTPAFDGNPEGCGKACFDWYAEYAKTNIPACGGLGVSLKSSATELITPATLTLTANVSSDAAAVKKVEFYNGTEKISEATSSPYEFVWKDVPAGKYSLTAVAFDADGNEATSQPVAVVVNVPQGPYSGEAASIPGRIEAENYDLGGEGYAYHDSDDKNEGESYREEGVDIEGDDALGYKLGYTLTDEWLEYTVDVKEAKTYDWKASVSSGLEGAAFRLYMDDVEITDKIEVPQGEDWQTYATITGKTSALTAGKHVMKISVEGAYFNLDYIEFLGNVTDATDVTSNKGLYASGIYKVFKITGECIGQVSVNGNGFLGEEANPILSIKGIYILKAIDNGRVYRIVR